MCARYTLAAAEKEILKAYAAEIEKDKLYTPNYNIAITDLALVITADDPHLFQYMHFGLVPWFSKTGKMERDSFNARNDNLLKSRMWAPLIKNHKTCLVITDGFYEWKKIENGTAKPDRDPYRFVVNDRPVFAFAGLWSRWRNNKNNEVYNSFAIATTEANETVGEIHSLPRMPVILPKGSEHLWLSKDLSSEQLVELCMPFPDEDMHRFQVSRAINSVNRKTAPNNSPHLIQPQNSI